MSRGWGFIARNRKGGRAAMRTLIIAIGMCAAAGTMSTRAEAQNYLWCAYYSGGRGGGGTNCGFTTFEQCMATVSGIGGFCDRNTQYVPAPSYQHHPRYRPRHKPHQHS